MDQSRRLEASDLVSGEFLEGLYLEHNAEFELWLLSERERWRIMAEKVLTNFTRGLIRRGHYSEALCQTRRMLKFSPWNETAHQTAMRLLAWTGQRGAALRQYKTCQSVLREEINIEPSDLTQVLYRKIEQGDLDLPPQHPAFLTEETARHTYEIPPFVGYEAELIQLDNYLQNTLRGKGQVVFITGGPGRGKTALLDNFAQVAMEDTPSLLVASGKCYAYAGRGDPFLPFRDLMGLLTGDVENLWDAGAITREHAQRLWSALPMVIQTMLNHGRQLIGTLVPGEDLLSRASNIEGSDVPWVLQLRECVAMQSRTPDPLIQSSLFHQVTRVLLEITQSTPLVIIMDDLQWADPASISLLFQLGRSLTENDARLLIACAYRPEEVGIQGLPSSTEPMVHHPLSRLLSEFKRSFGDIWIDLSHPEQGGGRLFVDALLDLEPNRLSDGFRQSLSARTGGHPLFTIELLQAMKEQGDLIQDDKQGWIDKSTLDWDLFPARVEAVIEGRINRLNPQFQEILEIASIEGEEFTAQVLAKSLGMAETDMLRQLSHTLERQHRLVKEVQEIYTKQGRISRFRFRHGLFQVYLYNRLSAGQQRLLHGQVAKHLEELHLGQVEEIAGKLARHYHLADERDQACRYYALAGDRAARLFANDEAQLHYSRAIELAERISINKSFQASLYRARGRVMERMGEFEHALSDHNKSLELARSLDDPELEWICLLDLGRLWAFRDYQRTREYFDLAISLARERDDPLTLASSMNWMGNWHMNMELPQQATSYHLEALEIAESMDNKQELANTLDLLGILKMMEGKQKAGKEYYDRAITLQRDMGDQVRLVSSLTGRAGSVMNMAFLANLSVCSIEGASDDLLEALQIAEEIGSITGKSWALYMQGMLDLVRGQFGRSRAKFLSGLKLATDVNHYEYMIANHFGIGALYLELAVPERARVHAESALQLAKGLHSQAMINYSAAVLAGAHIQLGEMTAAQSCLDKVFSIAASMDTIGKRYCWVRQVELALSRGEPGKVLDITERLIRSAPDMKSGSVIPYLWKIKADAFTAMGQAEKAIPVLLEAQKTALKNGELFLFWKLHASLSKSYRALGQESEADHQQNKTQDQIQWLADTIPDGGLKNHFVQSANERLTSSFQRDKKKTLN